MSDLFEVIYEDADLLVINKPAGLVCHPTKGDERSSLIGRMRLYLGLTVESPAHLVNRLDRETSGVVLGAKNPGAAGILGKIWEKRAVFKEYQAIVHGMLRQESGVIDLPLGKDEASIVAVKDRVREDGAPAVTEFKVDRNFRRNGADFTLVRVWPRTGRKHQIRIHFAALGHPLVGDKLYGGDEDIYLALAQNRLTDEHRQKLILTHQALHAGLLRFDWRGEEREFRAGPDAEFREFCDVPDGGPA